MRWLGALIITLVLCQNAWAAPTFDAATTSEDNDGDSSISFNHTVGGGCSNPIIVVAVAWRSNSSQTLDSMTIGGGAGTQVSAQADAGNTRSLAMWYRTGVSTGINAISGSFSAGAGFIVMSASSYCGVNSGAPVGTPTATFDENPTNASVTVTSAVGELVVDAVGGRNGGSTTLSVGAGQTSRSNFTDVSAATVLATSDEAGAASVSMDWTITNSSGWLQIGVALKPAGAAAGFVRRKPVIFQ